MTFEDNFTWLYKTTSIETIKNKATRKKLTVSQSFSPLFISNLKVISSKICSLFSFSYL